MIPKLELMMKNKNKTQTQTVGPLTKQEEQ